MTIYGLELLLISGLAGWRLASLFVHEDGPFHVFERLRQMIGIREGMVTGLLPLMFSCVWCLSIYTTTGCWALAELWRPEPVILIAAMSVAPIIERWVR